MNAASPAEHPASAPPAQATRQRHSFARRIQVWAFAADTAAQPSTAVFRLGVRIILIMLQEFFRTHIAIRASALTFSIILSLVPMLALSTSVLKGLGSAGQLHQAAIRFIDQLDPQEKLANDLPAAIPAPESPAAAEPIPNQPPHLTGNSLPADSLTVHLHHAVDVLFDYVERTNFAALGLVGVIGLIIVVLFVLSTIEDAMNAIWHTHKGRSFFRRIMDYLALLILLPISLNIALATEAVLVNKTIMAHISTLIPASWVAAALIKLVPFLFIVVTLLFMYLFFPHVKVKTSAALTGALFAAICWFMIQKLYILLQVGVANYNAIYGSFATVPLFLIWLQVGWTFILLGASLAHAIQYHETYDLYGVQLSPQRQLQNAFDLLRLVYDDFAQRKPTHISQLSNRIPQSRQIDLETVADKLVEGRLLCLTEDESEETLTPATPKENVTGGEVVSLLLGDEALTSYGGKLSLVALDGARRSLQAEQLFPQPTSEG